MQSFKFACPSTGRVVELVVVAVEAEQALTPWPNESQMMNLAHPLIHLHCDVFIGQQLGMDVARLPACIADQILVLKPVHGEPYFIHQFSWLDWSLAGAATRCQHQFTVSQAE